MGSATRGALAASVAVLDAQRSLTLQTAEQLLSACRAAAASPQLRTLLADPSLDSRDKAAVIARVFPGFGAPAVRALEAATAERWSRPGDLVDGIEELGIRAAAATAGRGDSVDAELFGAARIIAADSELELAVSSRLGDDDRKVELVERVFGGATSPATLVILRHLVRSPRGRRIGALIARTADVVADAGDRIVASVATATPLSTAQQKRLAASLAARYGRTPQLDVVLDPAVIGGIRVQIGDDVIDGSIASRLHDLRIRIAG